MTLWSSRIARFALLALAVGATSLSACGPCSCPGGGGGTRVTIPAAQSSPIADVSTSAPCTASASADGFVDVSTYTAGTCEVRVRLMNGETYGFSVVFQAMTIHGACECGVLRAADNSVPMLTDAGVDSL